MNGIHDLGGMHGLGPIVREENEPVFHEDWERRAFALTMATTGGPYSLDQFRHAVERMDPAEYLTSSYYEHWLHALETLLLEAGVIKKEEIENRVAELAKEAS
jgi:hypothetical protein